MSKYYRLGEYLKEHERLGTIRLSFEQIEDIVGFALPASAKRHRSFWSNNFRNNVMTEVWRKTHFKTEKVDMQSGQLVFRRVPSRQHQAAPEGASASQSQSLFKRLSQQVPREEPPQEARQSLLKRLSQQGSPGTTHPQDGKNYEPRRHPAYGALKGHIRLVAGTDLTKPANPHKDHNKP